MKKQFQVAASFLIITFLLFLLLKDKVKQ